MILDLVSPVYQGWWTQEFYQACTTTSSLQFTSKKSTVCISHVSYTDHDLIIPNGEEQSWHSVPNPPSTEAEVERVAIGAARSDGNSRRGGQGQLKGGISRRSAQRANGAHRAKGGHVPKDFIGREPYFLLSFYEFSPSLSNQFTIVRTKRSIWRDLEYRKTYHKSVRTHIVCDAQTKQNVKHGRDLIAADVCTILIHVFDHAQVDTWFWCVFNLGNAFPWLIASSLTC